MSFHVTCSRTALREIRETEDLLVSYSRTWFTRWHNRLVKIIQILAVDPHRYPEAIEPVNLGINIRMAIFGKRPHVYRVLFTIDSDVVCIVGIRHVSRDYLTEEDLN